MNASAVAVESVALDQQARILLVDDNTEMLAVVARILRLAGHAVTEAKTGTEALQIAEEIRPEIVLLDVVLPDIDGFEVGRRLKMDPANVGMHVVLLSGTRTSSDQQAEGLERGADWYITRPIERRELLARIQAIIRLRKAEQSLRDSEQLWRSVFAAANDALLVIDESAMIAACNRKAAEIYGYGEQELIGTPRERIAPDGEWGPQQDLPESSERDGLLFETVHRRADGTSIPVEVSGRSFMTAAGRHYIYAIRNITARKRREIDHIALLSEIKELNEGLERRVLERTDELQRANRELEAFSYSVSHDLRAPFRHIVGFADLLYRNSGELLDEQSQHYLKTISQAAKYAGTLVDSLLAFSRMARTELRKVRIDMNDLLEETKRSILEDLEEPRRINWTVGKLPEARVDPIMFRLVFQNLLSNAIKYSRRRPVAEIEIGSSTSETEHIFWVRDNGVGFDMRYIGKLFGVFQRLHRSEDFEGTGIGLANVQRIVQRHDGRVWAEGMLDVGATFFFSLPRTTQEPNDGTQAHSAG